MADNTAHARKEISGMRSAIEAHIAKWRQYSDANDKAFALKTIQRVQGDIAKLKEKHPSLRTDSNPLDAWRP
jgi:hypothetical protein